MAAQLSRALQEAVDSSKAALGGCVPSRRMTRSAAARESVLSTGEKTPPAHAHRPACTLPKSTRRPRESLSDASSLSPAPAPCVSEEALRAGASTFWASVKPRLRTPRGLVSVGGWDSGVTVVAVAELYDPLKDEWSPVPGPTLPRSCASVSVRSKDAQWQKVIQPPSHPARGAKRSLHCCCCCCSPSLASRACHLHRSSHAQALDGCLFVCGGCSDPGGRVSEASVEIWDPRRGTWTPGPPLSVRRSRLGAAALGRGLFVVGGFDGQRATYHSSCEVFEKRRGAWRRCADMIAARATMVRGATPAGSRHRNPPSATHAERRIHLILGRFRRGTARDAGCRKPTPPPSLSAPHAAGRGGSQRLPLRRGRLRRHRGAPCHCRAVRASTRKYTAQLRCSCSLTCVWRCRLSKGKPWRASSEENPSVVFTSCRAPSSYADMIPTRTFGGQLLP